VPLDSVARVEATPTPNEITRENGSRRIDVTSNVRGRDLGAVARDIQGGSRRWPFLRGLCRGPDEHAERQASSTRFGLLATGAIAAVFLILLADFGSGRLAILVFLTLPFALVGAIVATFLMGAILSLGSLVGLVTVIGISPRNGIMLVSHYRHLERFQGVPFGRDLVVRGSEERLAPILMPALATALALVPIVFGGSTRATKSSILSRSLFSGARDVHAPQSVHRVGAVSKYGRSAPPSVEDLSSLK
jgi:multidrug efflux pump subunit AcrB